MLLVALVLLTAAYELPSARSADRVKRVVASPLAAGHEHRRAENVFDSNPGTDFVTGAPDGSAFVGLEYRQPVRVLRVSHQPDRVFPEYRLTAAQLQWSDDGVAYHAASRVVSDPESNLTLECEEPEPHRYWRLLVLRSGPSTLVVLGEVSITTAGTEALRRAGNVLHGLALLALVLAVIAVATRCGTSRALWWDELRWAWHGLSRTSQAFWTVVIALLGYYNYFYLWKFTVLPVIFPDTSAYVLMSPVRTPGYSLLLRICELLTTDLQLVPGLQLNALLFSVVLLALVTAKILDNYLAGVALLLLLTQSEFFFVYPAWILTEALFSASVTCHVALILLLIHRFTTLRATGAGLTLMLATALKSVGLVFVLPAAVSLAFCKSRRTRAALLLLAPALGLQFGVSTFNYTHHGFFATSTLGGPALLGQVAWNVQRAPDSAYPDLAGRIEDRIAPLLAERPEHFASLIDYASYTTGEYNKLLWGTVWPEIQSDVTAEGLAHDPALVRGAEIAMTLALESIRRAPARYAYHVVAHYYGMWRVLFPDAVLARELAAGVRQTAGTQHIEMWKQRMSAAAVEEALDPAMFTERRLRSTAPVAFFRYVVGQDLHALRFFSLDAAAALFFISLLGCCAVFVAPRLGTASAAWCVTSLYANAYMSGHALFQVYLARYGAVLQPVAWSAGLFAVFASARAGAAILRRRRARRAGAPVS